MGLLDSGGYTKWPCLGGVPGIKKKKSLMEYVVGVNVSFIFSIVLAPKNGDFA